MTRMLSYPSALGRFYRSLPTSGKIGLLISTAWMFVAVFGTWIAPFGMEDLSDGDIFGGLSAAFPFGTDYLGRDMLSRVLHGAKYSIGLALTSALLASVSGTLLALLASVIGRWFDEIVSRIVDALLVTPSKIFALLMIAVYGSSLPILVFTAAITYMPGAYRIARAQAVNLNTMEYVMVARLRGEGSFYIACREILPNMIHPMLADFGLRFVYIVLMLSGLSFLGLGVQPPYADWGSLVRENLSGLFEGAPAVVAPALAIATLTIGANLFIDSLTSRRRIDAPGDTE